EQLVARVADDFAELVVDPQVAQVERDERHSHRGLVERGTQHLVAVDPADPRFSLCRPRLTAHPCLPKQRVTLYQIVRSCASRAARTGRDRARRGAFLPRASGHLPARWRAPPPQGPTIEGLYSRMPGRRKRLLPVYRPAAAGPAPRCGTRHGLPATAVASSPQ